MVMRGFECNCLKYKKVPVELPSSRLGTKSVNC